MYLSCYFLRQLAIADKLKLAKSRVVSKLPWRLYAYPTAVHTATFPFYMHGPGIR